MYQVMVKRNVCHSVFIFELGIICTYIGESELDRSSVCCISAESGYTVESFSGLNTFPHGLQHFPKLRGNGPVTTCICYNISFTCITSSRPTKRMINILKQQYRVLL